MVDIIDLTKIKHYRRIFRVCPKRYKNISKKVPKRLVESIADPEKGKKCLEEDEVKALLGGHVTIDEKIDGGVLGLAWDGIKPLVVGKHSMVNYDLRSKKFYGLREWIYDNYNKISEIPLGWVVYGEWMRSQHNIPYDNFFVGFDIFDGTVKGEFLNYIDRSVFLDDIGFAEVPFVYSGTDLGIEDIICITEGVGGVSNKSRFNSKEIMEGVIIRNDNGLIGKYVRREFMDEIEDNWLTTPLVENKLASWKLINE
jgi:RNA ligase